MKARLLSGLSLVLAPLATAAAPGATMEFTGVAKTDDGRTIYQELHRVEGVCREGLFRPQGHQINYQHEDAASPFATKSLEYTDSVLRPAVDFRQPDFDESLTIRYPEPETLVINWQRPNGETQTFDVPYPSDLVVDAGFDNLVRRHWEEVVRGQRVDFRFLGPTRGEHYGFTLETVQQARVKAPHVLQIRPTGMFLQFLVDPIVIGYDDKGALTDYYGLTNIRKDEDTNYVAHIRYSVDTWPDCELTR